MTKFNFNNMKSKLFLPFLVSVVVIVGVVAAYFFIFYTRQYDVRQFNGSLTKVEGDVVTIKGVFHSSAGQLPKSLLTIRDLSFKVDNSTQFHKVTVLIPSREEVQKAGGQLSYSLDDRPKEVGPGSIDDLALNTDNPNVFVEAEFSASIYRTRTPPLASKVTYRILSLPSFLPR